ncbi:MAG: nitroreductase family protein [Candidatus Helarchaeota archaeon]|nr:nitroreductase family protein [Candidatus Helarchaeota archaeon]
MPEFLEVLQTRRSIRRYKSQSIPKELILEILDLCRYAANAHNAQPFRFIILLNEALKNELIKSMASRYETDLRNDGLPEPNIQKIIANSTDQFLKAPVLIIACLIMDDMHQYPDPQRQYSELLMGVQSVANSIQNLLLVAHSKGLGACWFCAPLFCPDLVKSILNLPTSYIPQAFITLGIPDEMPSPIKRKQLEDLIHIIE